jgi:hypothetical protein
VHIVVASTAKNTALFHHFDLKSERKTKGVIKLNMGEKQVPVRCIVNMGGDEAQFFILP